MQYGENSNTEVFPSVNKLNKQDYTPQTAINASIPTDDGLTHEEKAAAINRLERTGNYLLICSIV